MLSTILLVLFVWYLVGLSVAAMVYEDSNMSLDPRLSRHLVAITIAPAGAALASVCYVRDVIHAKRFGG